ncbi:hypothetical protein ACFSJS_16455 [Streptomyces desertarenae]|uniref:Uncharacterized protein n=1 Tax=Streptomyces desertarenae TaxID=2666184 RepID=A0ABW4PM23_9ACTN
MPLAVWLAPARRRRAHAVIPTPYGDCVLFRGPGTTAKAEVWEQWELTLGGQTVLEVEDAAAPWHGVRARARSGMHGRLGGVPFTARARHRAIRPSRRAMRFTLDDGRTLAFTAHRLHRHLVLETSRGREVIASSRGTRWRTDRLGRPETALVCFTVVSGLDALLASPLQDLPLPL